MVKVEDVKDAFLHLLVIFSVLLCNLRLVQNFITNLKRTVCKETDARWQCWLTWCPVTRAAASGHVQGTLLPPTPTKT
jgi:hypothetical protein